MRTFQRLANANEGTRAATTPGYEASIDFVERRLDRAGYETTRHEFPFATWQQNGPATLQLGATTPFTEGPPEGATEGGDYIIAQFSGSGDVTGPIVPIDYTGQPPTSGSSTSGCETTDFTTPPSPTAIALMQRGTCTFVVKIRNAVAAGYAGVLIANDGFTDRTEPIQIGADPFTPIPVAMTSFGVGEQLRAAAGQDLRFAVSTTTEETTQQNLIADTTEGDPEHEPSLDATGLEEGSEAADAALMRGNGPKGLGQLADAAAHATWTLARSRSPLVGPAVARMAKASMARRKFRAAAKRAADNRQWKGGQQIR